MTIYIGNAHPQYIYISTHETDYIWCPILYEPAALTKAYGYTDFNISAHTTKTCIIGRVGRTRRKKTTNQYDEENRWVFSFDFKD